MYGIQAVFGPMNISFSSHKCEIEYYDNQYDLYAKNDLDINRITAFFSFK